MDEERGKGWRKRESGVERSGEGEREIRREGGRKRVRRKKRKLEFEEKRFNMK